MGTIIDEILKTQDYINHETSCNCKQCRQQNYRDNEFLDNLFDFFNEKEDLLDSRKVKSAIDYNQKYGKSLGWLNYYNDIVRKVLKMSYLPDEADFAQKIAKWQSQNGYSGNYIDGKLGSGTWEKMKVILGLKSGYSTPTTPNTTSPNRCLRPVGSKRVNAVIGSKIYSEFLQKRGTRYHTGIDVTTKYGGTGKNDEKRGLPVYATLKPYIELSELNSTCLAIDNQGKVNNGMGIKGNGKAILKYAKVRIPQNGGYGLSGGSAYGGVVGLACVYSYTTFGGLKKEFTLFIEYLHLITERFLPYYKTGGEARKMTRSDWVNHPNSRNIGFGRLMKHKAILSPEQLTSGRELIGYLGATNWPHVHIQANYSSKVTSYKMYPRFDPMIMIN
ncbi:MAG: hypothetical protein KDD99_14595 [Bacteroidetes bacterium]|nr:hypothetical protein [Bacteroidota bacterium]